MSSLYRAALFPLLQLRERNTEGNCSLFLCASLSVPLAREQQQGLNQTSHPLPQLIITYR